MENFHFPQEVDVHRQPHLQDAPGILNHAELEEDFESPSADLTEPEETVSRFQTVGRSIEDLPIEGITHFTLIPDFFHPTSNDRPIVVRTPEGLFCIDGWDLIVKAVEEGQVTISCEVDEMVAHSDAELCLRKAAIRSATRGGKGEYLENARNARDLWIMLLSSNEVLRDLGHGGRRRGEGFVANSEDNVRYVIANRLGKEPDTINKYLNHLEYLSDAAVGTLIARGAKKRFFEKAQRQKRILLKTYREDGSSPEEEIIQNVSSLMIALFNRQSESGSGARRSRSAATSRETLTFGLPTESTGSVPRREEDEDGFEESEAPDDVSEQTARAEDEQEDVIRDEEDESLDTRSGQAASDRVIEESSPDEEVGDQLAEIYNVSEASDPLPQRAVKDPRVIEMEFADEIIQVLYVIAEKYEDLMPDLPLTELESILREDISTLQEFVKRIVAFRKK